MVGQADLSPLSEDRKYQNAEQKQRTQHTDCQPRGQAYVVGPAIIFDGDLRPHRRGRQQ